MGFTVAISGLAFDGETLSADVTPTGGGGGGGGSCTLNCDTSANDAYVTKTVTFPADWWYEYEVMVTSATLAALAGAGSGSTAYLSDAPVQGGFTADAPVLGDNINPSSLSPPPATFTTLRNPGAVVASAFPADAWNLLEQHSDGTTMDWYLNGSLILSYAYAESPGAGDIYLGGIIANDIAGEVYQFRNVKLGTSRHGTDIFADAFASGDTSAWTTTVGDVTVIDCVSPPPTPPSRGRCDTTQVRFLITDLATVPTTWLDNLSLGATLTYNLLQPATIDIPVRSNDKRVNTIFVADGDPLLAQSNRLCYAFFKEGGTPPWVCRGAGIAMSPQDQADADVPVTHMVFYDPWQYLLGRPCFEDTAGTVIGPNGLLFPATEMGHIAATLLKNSIVSEGIGTFIDAGAAYGGTAFWAGTIETTPVVDYTVQQGQMVGDAWNQIVALQDPSGGTNLGGCDIILTPIYDPVNRPGYTHELSIYNLAGQDLHTSPMAWGTFVRSSTTADRQHDGTPGSFVNVADFHVGMGGYPVPIGGPPPENSPSVAIYRTYWETSFFPSQTSAASVLALAQQELQLRKQGKRTFTVNPDPLRSGVPIRDYNIGDRIPLNVTKNLRVFAHGHQRIQTIPVDVNPDGMTRVQNLLTSPDWRGV